MRHGGSLAILRAHISKAGFENVCLHTPRLLNSVDDIHSIDFDTPNYYIHILTIEYESGVKFTLYCTNKLIYNLNEKNPCGLITSLT